MRHDKEETRLDEKYSGTNSNDSDIAVIGMSGRFPMAGNLEEFWMNLKRGKYCVGDIPEARVEDWRSLYEEGTVDIPQFGYMKSISRFDSQFFNIPPGEAGLIDPAQRMLLEVVYHALEYGGYGGKRIANTRTGVFVACGNSRYSDLMSSTDYSMTAEVGNLPAVSAGRVSHFFDLRGPSLLIDTACSSSLAALHYACESLKRGECSMTIVGAVNIYAYLGSKVNGNDGGRDERAISNRLRVFDDSTSGVLNGEGVGALLLKPLSRALKDGDIICAVIKGTSLSHNGARTAAISGQNPESLAEVIRLGLENAAINPETLSYMEASGTATKMGDPIEIKAISDVFSTYTEKKQFCAIGSVKSNLGHLNHASGLASLIKVILALQHKQRPPLARFEKPNSYIDFKNSPVYIEKELKNWELGENKTRRAGVSSFSVNGTNCHVIMEEAPTPEPMEYPDRFNILTLSAKNPVSMQKLCAALKESIRKDSALLLEDVCHTMNTGRGQYEYRLAVVCKNKEECIKGLNAIDFDSVKKIKEKQAGNGDVLWGNNGQRSVPPEAKAVFLFPGGKDAVNLQETCWDFYRKGFIAGKYMEECGTFYDLEKYPQVLVFAFQYALAKLWMDLGIKPAFVLGFGIGKYVSRVISEKFNLEEALNICLAEYNREDFHNFNRDKLTHHIAQLYSRGQMFFLEMGPDNELGKMTEEVLKGKPGAQVLLSYDSAIKEKTLFRSIGNVYTRGVHLDFSSLFHGRKVALPTYPFHRQRYWVKAGTQPKENNISGLKTSALQTPPAERTPSAATLSQVEEILTRMWQTFFGIENIRNQDDFFQLGGDSLRAMTIISEIHKELHVSVPLTEFFSHPTIRELAQFISKAEKSMFSSIEPAEKKHYYALSPNQLRLCILQEFDPDSTAYNMPQMLVLEGTLARERLEKTFWSLIKRHESLRTSFQRINDEAVQKIHVSVEFKIEYYDMKEIETKVEEGEPAAALISSFIRPFDLSRAPLLRIGLINTSRPEGHPSQEDNCENRHILMVDMHHIISDGVSHAILIQDFMDCYAGKELSPLRLQYKDYSQWQNSKKGKQEVKAQQEYWLNRFKGEIPVLSLPTDLARPPRQRFEGETIPFVLDKEKSALLNDLALKENVSIFILLLAIFNAFLAKVSGSEDIVIGMGINGRRHDDLQDIVGMFVNTLAMRNFPRQNRNFREFLGQLKQDTLNDFDNQDYPFEELVEKLEVKRDIDISRNPLFDVMFQFNNYEIPELVVLGLKLKPYTYSREVSKFDLTLWGSKEAGQLSFAFEYSTKLFKRETIEIFIRYFFEIVSSVISDPERELREINRISDRSKQRILEQMTRETEVETIRINGRSRIFQHCLKDNLVKFENNIAVEYGPFFLTYGELDKRSNQIANLILAKVMNQKEAVIGVLMEDMMQLLCTTIGILKAGCIFVPLDSTYPKDRLEKMIGTLDIKFTVVDKYNVDIDLKQQSNEMELILIDRWFTDGESSGLIHSPDIQYQPEDKIYIYFTSGSTGTPKAIVGKNSSLLHFIDWEIGTFGVDETFTVSQLITPGFDAFLRDVFVPLCAGGRSCIPFEQNIKLNPGELAKWVERSRINLIHCVPTLFRLLKPDRLTSDNFGALNYVLFSGEKINASDLIEWYDVFGERITFVNLYGPTETTLIKTYHFVERDDLERERIPVGKPMRGAGVMILDSDMNLCDKLVSGEIYIHTPYGTYGYYNEPDLNSEKFLKNPFGSNTDDVVYKTGDIGRLMADGSIDLIGRYDRQVKMRGIRIELEEIESVLMEHLLIKEAVVIKKELENHNQLLCAYIIENNEHNSALKLSIEAVRKYLYERVPDYMVPAGIVKLEKIPRNPSGKIDYNVLDNLEAKKQDYLAPTNDVEKKLIELWEDILKREKIGIGDNFFSLGGNSLNIMALISHIHRVFDVRIPLGEIFVNPSVAQQAKIIKEAVEEKCAPVELVEVKEYYPLSPAQKRIYVMHQIDPNTTAYNISQIILVHERLDKDLFEDTLNKLINRHESLRTSFHMVEDQPVQRIHNQVEFEVKYYDKERFGIGAGSYYDGEKCVVEGFVKNFIKPFDLSGIPLLRVGLLRAEEQKYILIVDMHHIISDGVSHGIIIHDFMTLYQKKELPPLRLQYKDFSQWQNRLSQSEEILKQEEYWLADFNEDIPALNLPTDYVRPLQQNFEGRSISFEIGVEETDALKALALREGVTLFMVLLAIYYVLLHKLSGQEVIVVGIPTASRSHADLEQIIGMFVNTLALKNRPMGKISFKEFLLNVKNKTLAAFENQDYQFERLVQKVASNRDMSRNPIFDVMFLLQNMGAPDIEIPGLKMEVYDYKNRTAKFDLNFIAQEAEQKLIFKAEYNTKLFKQETIESFILYFNNIAEAVIENPGKTLSVIKRFKSKNRKVNRI